MLRLGAVLLVISFNGKIGFAEEAIPLVRVVAIVGDSAVTSYDLEKEVNSVKKH